MSSRKLCVRATLLVLWFAFFTSAARAQYRTSIQGVVFDPSGAAVPGATLTLTNTVTGEKQVRVTNDDGLYNFNALPAAPFRLEVEKKDFATTVLDNIRLIPEQPNALNIQLEVSTAQQTIEVNASLAPAIDTETAS